MNYFIVLKKALNLCLAIAVRQTDAVQKVCGFPLGSSHILPYSIPVASVLMLCFAI
jgi:hypothetical protein